VAEAPSGGGEHPRGGGLGTALAVVATVVAWPLLRARSIVHCHRHHRAIAGSVPAGRAHRDESGRWEVLGQHGGSVAVTVSDVATARWVVFDNGVQAGQVGDAEAWLFELNLRNGGTVRLHDPVGLQLGALRDELVAAGLLTRPARRPGCQRWGLGDVLGGALWLLLLAVLVGRRW
jgi:hypothetical protein